MCEVRRNEVEDSWLEGCMKCAKCALLHGKEGADVTAQLLSESLIVTGHLFVLEGYKALEEGDTLGSLSPSQR